MLIALVALAIDSTLPAMPAMAQALGTDAAEGQLILTGLLVGVACGQMLWGPLSDRTGRRPVLLAGLALALGASLACAAATSIGALSVLRFVQGLGLSSASVVARSVVRDLYVHEQAARMLSRMTIVFAVVPIAAPIAGSALLAGLGWRAVFVLHAAAAALLLAAAARTLRETAPRAGAHPSRPGLYRTCAGILTRREFVAPFLLQVAVHIGIMAWITNSAFVLIRGQGVSASAYSLLFALVMLGQIAGAYGNSRLVQRFGIVAMMRAGSALAALAGLAALGLALAGVGHWAALVAPQALYMLASGLILPNATAAALSPFPESAGTAASLMGTLQFAIAAAVGIAIGALYDGSALPLAAALAAGGVAALIVLAWLPRRDEASAHG